MTLGIDRNNKTLVGIAGLLLLKLFLTFGTSLGDDEAYYWVWSQTAFFGFYDHPPVVAWFIGLFTTLFGDNVFAVRLPTLLVYGLSFAYLMKISWYSGIQREPTHTLYLGLCFLAIPILYVGSILTTPDPFFLFFWIYSYYWFLSRIHLDRIASRDWIVLGIILGLAGLTKLTVLVLGLCFFLALLLIRPALLNKKGPWVAFGVFAFLFSFYVTWNASHDWASFAFHFSERHSPSFNLGQGFGWFLIQLIVLGITLGILLFKYVLKDILQFRFDRSSRVRLCFFLPVFLLFWYQAFWSEFKIHWALPAYLPYLSPIAHSLSRGSALYRRIMGSVPMTLCFILGVQLVYPLYPLWLGDVSQYSTKTDPANDLLGWDEFTVYLKEKYGDYFEKESSKAFASQRYQTASQFWFASKLPTYSLGPQKDHYDFINMGSLSEDVQNVLFFGTDKYKKHPLEILPEGFSCSEERRFNTTRFGVPSRTFFYWICEKSDDES